jgi:hypothetical protein
LRIIVVLQSLQCHGVCRPAATVTFSSDLLHEETYTTTLPPWRSHVVVQNAGELRATLVWSDPAPVTLPGAGLDDATSVLVNDLDVWVEGPTGTIYRPFVLDPANPNALATRARNFRDNVEQVSISLPGNGQYTIYVGHTLKPGQTSYTQNFSLLVSGVYGIVGDMNGDGEFDNEDITPFVDALLDPGAWQALYGRDPNLIGDVNRDGALDNEDITPFTDWLTTDGNLAQPTGGGSGMMLAGGGGDSLAREQVFSELRANLGRYGWKASQAELESLFGVDANDWFEFLG